MKIGIDASNIRGGGGVTHLVALLGAAKPQKYNFEQVIVWGSSSTLNRIRNRDWLRKVHDPLLDRGLPLRLYWQRIMLDRLAHMERCDILFIPGGSYFGEFRPFVTMSQNLLPFDLLETKRYGFSWMFLRNLLLRWLQTYSFQTADGVVFLSRYARDSVLHAIGGVNARIAVIPHGVERQFLQSPRDQEALEHFTHQRPLRLLYVSIIDMYKHQWRVAKAVGELERLGLPVQLDLIGPAYAPALSRLRLALQSIDPEEAFIHYRGSVSYTELSSCYHAADIFIFASSCENMPNILLEAMASGLPIACSKCGPMPEVLGDAGTYFDPERVSDIANAITNLVESPTLRRQKAEAAYELAQSYTWERCAEQTFAFLSSFCR